MVTTKNSEHIKETYYLPEDSEKVNSNWQVKEDVKT